MAGVDTARALSPLEPLAKAYRTAVAEHPQSLVVEALDRGALGLDGARGQAARLEAHLVVGVSARLARVPVVAENVGQMLLERAAAGDVEHLHPAADPQDRHAGLQRRGRHGQLEAVAHGLHRLGARMPGLAVVGRIDVARTLAVTFTRKAAGELVERLGALGAAPTDDHFA